MDDATFVPFEEQPHTADLALVARGRDFRELLLNACRGVLWALVDSTGLALDEWVLIRSLGSEPERVLLGLVKQILVQWELREGLPVAVEVESAPDDSWFAAPSVPAEAHARLGFAFPPRGEERVKAVPKAATYHDLAIRRVGELLEVTIVLDL
jgi:SHS2 domain-containing protein